MKTKMLLAAFVATALTSISTVQAGERLLSPRASENQTRTVMTAGAQKNPDTLAMDKNCPLSPKAKDGSLACKKCCMATAKK
ncbi:MAG: hypothetical protein ABJC04_10990 [Verrucomicrobiota bacterium]